MTRKLTTMMALLGLLVATPALATSYSSSSSSDLTVRATVTSPIVCNVDMWWGPWTDIRFDSYLTTSGQASSTQSFIRVYCSASTSFTVYPSWGQNKAGTSRYMARGDGPVIAYDLYKDSGYQQLWTEETKLTVTGSGGGQEIPIFARIPGGQGLLDGTADGWYSDTIDIVIEYSL